MPWTATEFKSKHAKHLTDAQAAKAASIANGILNSGGDEGVAIATGIKRAKETAAGIPNDMQFGFRVRNVSNRFWTYDIYEKYGRMPEDVSVGECHSKADAMTRGRQAAKDKTAEYKNRRETSAIRDWWSGMSKKRQEAYLAAHPHSDLMKEADSVVHNDDTRSLNRTHHGTYHKNGDPKLHQYESYARSRHEGPSGVDSRYAHHKHIEHALNSLAKKHGFEPVRDGIWKHPQTEAHLVIHKPHRDVYTDTHAGYGLHTPRDALRPETAAYNDEHEIVVRYKGDFNFPELIRKLGFLGNAGCSRSVTVNYEEDPLSLGFDGDGADKIISASVDGTSFYPEKAETSMLNKTKLFAMANAEMAADDWFHRLSKKEQEAYIKAHPTSKFGRGGKTPPKSGKSSSGGGLHFDVENPKLRASIGDWATKHGIKHKLDRSGSVSGDTRVHLNWHPDNAAKIHSFMKRTVGSPKKGTSTPWEDYDAHGDVDGWKKLHKHVTGRDAAKQVKLR